MRAVKVIFRKLRAFTRNLGGTSAVEFSLVAPVLILGALATVDVGLALGERISLNHVVRSGAQSAMIDAGEDETRTVITATAANNFVSVEPETDDWAAATNYPDADETTEPTGTTNGVSVSVNRMCACPDAPDVAVSCLNICVGDVPPNIYYDMLASKIFPSMFIPPIDLRAAMRVQVR